MNQTETNGYISYQALLTSITGGISNLSKICNALEMTERADALAAAKQKLQNHAFSVGIMGEFKRGKSTVINALLGKEVLPADILPCSATLNQIKWDSRPHAEVRFKDGSVKEVSIEELADYVTKLTEESEQNSANVDEAVVYYPCQFCQNGVKIIDTPGLNDDERMNQVAESVLPTLDAIIMVIVPDAPFSISEADFVRNKVMFSDLARIVFVINKIDMVRPRDRQRVIDSITKKIQSSVLEKVSSIYGEDSTEYHEAVSKLGGIRVYPLSARDALDGKLEGDAELLEESGMVEFEQVLTKLLTEERGLLELVAPVNTLLGAAKEASDIITMRRNALQMDAQEFESVQQRAIVQIREIREKKREEVERIKTQSKNVYSELLPQIDVIYDDLESRLLSCIDSYPLSPENVKTKEAERAVAETISQKMDQEFRECLGDHTELLQTRIMNSLGDEMAQIQTFNQDLMQQMSGIRCLIPEKQGIDTADVAGVVVDTVTSYGGILAIGGIISGWKANGIPGALVGGGAGFAAGYLAMLGALSLGVVGLPLALVGGVVSTFGGKAVTKLVFGKKIAERNIEQLRSELRKSAYDSLDSLKSQRMLETWLKGAADNAFLRLSEELDRDTETMLQDTESTLSQIRIDLERGKADRQSVLNELEKQSKLLYEVCEVVIPVKKKLDGTDIQVDDIMSGKAADGMHEGTAGNGGTADSGMYGGSDMAGGTTDSGMYGGTDGADGTADSGMYGGNDMAGGTADSDSHDDMYGGTDGADNISYGGSNDGMYGNDSGNSGMYGSEAGSGDDNEPIDPVAARKADLASVPKRR